MIFWSLLRFSSCALTSNSNDLCHRIPARFMPIEGEDISSLLSRTPTGPLFHQVTFLPGYPDELSSIRVPPSRRPSIRGSRIDRMADRLTNGDHQSGDHRPYACTSSEVKVGQDQV